ncbi:alpha/beta hydrolase [Nonomuraea glycinis]|uniref:Alpha/beta hydrolase n=1 Tax=Nonomuraea glycinis TaxID=2047744 RepID=A0A918E9K2_9ACTN|nr:alpha/beta hydrolase [Nonomuraea glycinis]MCA2181147.1 alpha/beta hydrolase [Nonomuraea glycinis]GGP13569.1 alpha/beta hydrolase [Nonomuraea glycinis]
MNKVISTDGTPIAYDRTGAGPAVILIGGGPTDRSMNAPVADLLAGGFTVYNYDRRGRGESGDTAPYAVERELEDLRALIAEAGGTAMVYGTSGGGFLAIRAAAHGLPITKLALWEVPYILPGTRPAVPAGYRDQQFALREQSRYGDMLELFFLEAVLMPEEVVAGMKASPFWEGMGGTAPALAYDAELAGDFALPAEQLAALTVPTIVIDGETIPWVSAAAEAIATALPDARRHTLTGQPHNVDPAAIAPALAEFFAA